MNLVPNEFPRSSIFNKIAIVGEAPGDDEVTNGRPFVGFSGKLLSGALNSVGISRDQCFIGNVCNLQPPGNIIERFRWEGPEIQDGMRRLKKDLESVQPNIVVLLGATALKAAGFKQEIASARGSIFKCQDPNSPFFGFKCIPSYHPAFILRAWNFWPLLQLDLKKAKENSADGELNYPKFDMYLHLTADEVIDNIRAVGEESAMDIEGGGPNGITCLSIAPSLDKVFQINPFEHGTDKFAQILKELAKFLRDPDRGKILQNGSYDSFCLGWHWKMPIMNISWDTMLSGWELYPELPKGLGVQASLYTNFPSYKFMKKSDAPEVFNEYNCLDSLITFHLKEAHRKQMTPEQMDHFRFNMELLPVSVYMTLRGMNYDTAYAKDALEDLEAEMREVHAMLDTCAGSVVNCNSPQQKAKLLYETWGMEKVYKKLHGRKTSSVTTDREALLHLADKYQEPGILHMLRWTFLEGIREQLAYLPDAKKRMRAFYNIVGTETGRFSCSMKETEKADKMHLPGGAPLHVITKKNRPMLAADEGYWFAQMDLEGADGWTVAAECAAENDDTMLLDYYAKLKPAKTIAMEFMRMFQGRRDLPPLGSVSREEVHEILKTLEIPEWLYYSSKRAQHATNYGVKPQTMQKQILLDSYKVFGTPIKITQTDCQKLQAIYLDRYPGVAAYQANCRSLIDNTSQMSCASGHVRTFFGRRGSDELYREGYCHRPQANTTYVVNLAAYKLWNDPENRKDSSPGLFIEPLHQHHDAICVQFLKDRTDWAKARIFYYFNNPINIAGTNLVIPYDGRYGSSWGNLTEGTL